MRRLSELPLTAPSLTAPSLAILSLVALPSTMGCGQYVNAEDALGNTSNAGATELATRDELATATSLMHYGQEALLVLHTSEGEYLGGTSRYVDYDGMLASPEAQLVLSDSLANIASVDPSSLTGKDERLAFWLNVYNLATVAAVVAELEADPDWGGVSEGDFAMFNTPLAQVGGHTLTLNAVEHGVIRGDQYAFDTYFDDADSLASAQQWNSELWNGDPVDARIHVGLNCASLGCPNILDGAFRAEDLDAVLDELSTAFVDHPGKGAGPEGISQLFSWFGGDFDGSHGGVQGFVQQYRTAGDADVDYDSLLDYSWELNAE